MNRNRTVFALLFSIIMMLTLSNAQDTTITTTQSFSGGTFSNVTINGSGIVVTLTGMLTINGTLTLTNGIIVTTIANIINMSDGSSISGGSLTSYVEGPMLIRWPSGGTDIQKTFPLGKNSKYRPMKIKFASATSQQMRAELFTGNCGGTPGTGLTKISPLLYFHVLTRAGTAGSTTFSLGYFDEDGVSDSKSIKIGSCTGAANGVYENVGSGGVLFASGTTPGFIDGLSYTFTDAGEYLIHATNDAVKNPLPVELTNFNAVSRNTSIDLQWSTASELNNAGFEIERMDENGDRSWGKRGFVAGNGSSNTVHQYSFVDRATPGTYHYRLKQIDRDGAIEYSQSVVVSVTTNLQYSLEQNYPNPFNPSTIIRYRLAARSRVLLTIFDILGQQAAQLVHGEQSEGIHELEWKADVAAGVYYLKIDASNIDNPSQHFTQIRKMILLR